MFAYARLYILFFGSGCTVIVDKLCNLCEMRETIAEDKKKIVLVIDILHEFFLQTETTYVSSFELYLRRFLKYSG
jgi:hypothetical protein